MTTINVFVHSNTKIARIQSGVGDIPTRRRKAGDRINRIGDVVLASVLLLFTLPLLGITALAVKCSGQGPVLCRCKRVVRDDRQIVVLRFRTTMQQPQSVRSTVSWDKPLTAVGRFLCWTRIDALPQLFNVLRGEMTLVGIEAERPDFLRS